MIVFIIIGVVFIAGWIAVGRFEKDQVIGFLAGLALAVASFLVFLLIATLLSFNSPYQESVEEVPLVALGSAQGAVEGSFLLGSGSVNSRPQFLWMEDRGDYMQLSNVGAERVRIYEGEKDNPHVRKISKRRQTPGFFPIVLHRAETEEYEIHVPKGTVEQRLDIRIAD